MRRLGLLAVFVASNAHAAAGEAMVSASTGYVLEAGVGPTRQGFLGTVDAWWGLDDFAWVAASASTGGLFAGASESSSEPSSVPVEGLAGVVLTLDVLRWVPWAELMAGAVGPADAMQPSGRLGLGVDYLWAPSWAIGVAARIRPIPTSDGVEALGSVQLRISHRFEL